MPDLGKGLGARRGDAAEVRRLGIDREEVSRDGTRKLRLCTSDGRMIEMVLIPDGNGADAESDGASGEEEEEEEAAALRDHSPDLVHRWFPRRPKLTLCISSQVGCALDCRFCGTATLGF